MNDAARVLAFVMLLLLPAKAGADGMAFRNVSTGGSLEVRATAQRAVMWLRSSVWEIHVQPVFEREAGASAWVIPFPVQPQVHASSTAFFDQLELVTSPVFLKYCSEDSGGVGCGAARADGYGGESSDGSQVSVTVWQSGEVGSLDYVVLSASGGDDIAAWLESEGYYLSAPAAAILGNLDTEGLYFFAARLSEDADPLESLAPVRFVLPGMDPPSYPLRLTGLGAPAGEALDLTIWVIVDADRGFVPQSHPYGYLSVDPRDPDEYDAAIDRYFEGHGPGMLVALAAVGWELPTIMESHEFCAEFMVCATFSDLDVEPPTEWATELEEIKDSSFTIYRYQGRLTAEAMASDLTLVPAPAYDMPWASNVYGENLGDCDDIGPYSFCAMAGRPGVGWIALVALLVAGAALLFLRKTRARR